MQEHQGANYFVCVYVPVRAVITPILFPVVFSYFLVDFERRKKHRFGVFRG